MSRSEVISELSHVGPVPWGEQQPPQADSLPALIEFQAQLDPERPAIVAGDTRLTYQQFNEQVIQLAASLQAQGVNAETKVALLAPNDADWLISAFAALRLGVELHTFHTWVHAWDLEYLLGAAGTEVLITAPRVRSNDILGELRELVPEAWQGETIESAKFPALRTIISIGDDVAETPLPASALLLHDLVAAGADLPAPSIAAVGASTAVVLYTSGTTEFPKAVPLAHRALVENGFAIGERMGLGNQDRVWLGSPLFWSFGIANAGMATFTHGACLVVQERFTAESAAELMGQEQCTAAYLLPSIALALVEEARDKMRSIASLRTGLIIGRPEEVARTITELDIPELCNVYGSTETYGNCCVTSHKLDAEVRAVTQGLPLDGNELRVVDLESGEIVPVGEAGELQIRGRVMSGYLNNVDATASALTSDGWYRTGDLGRLRSDGMMEFVSRHSEMIKTSGINVSPSEVEAFIERLDGVEQVVVVGAPHPERGEVPVAFIVEGEGVSLSEAEVIADCKRSIASFKVPWAVEIIDEVPQTVTGKVTRKALLDDAAAAVESRLAAAKSAGAAS